MKIIVQIAAIIVSTVFALIFSYFTCYEYSLWMGGQNFFSPFLASIPLTIIAWGGVWWASNLVRKATSIPDIVLKGMIGAFAPGLLAIFVGFLIFFFAGGYIFLAG